MSLSINLPTTCNKHRHRAKTTYGDFPTKLSIDEKRGIDTYAVRIAVHSIVIVQDLQVFETKQRSDHGWSSLMKSWQISETARRLHEHCAIFNYFSYELCTSFF